MTLFIILISHLYSKSARLLSISESKLLYELEVQIAMTARESICDY